MYVDREMYIDRYMYIDNGWSVGNNIPVWILFLFENKYVKKLILCLSPCINEPTLKHNALVLLNKDNIDPKNSPLTPHVHGRRVVDIII